MLVSDPQRYCPSCGLETDAAFCPEDGVSTVERRRLDVDVTAIHAGDVIEGRYRVTGVLGRGGFGAVYSAEHTGTQQPVALKMMLADPATTDDDEIRRFYREARITANLSHANTVRVFDVGQTASGALFIAMELLHGPTLEQHLRDRYDRGEVLSEREAIEIAIPILRSLYEAHRKGLVHRDLKPANIMLSRIDMGDAVDNDDDNGDDDDDDDVLIKVLDFGIARPQGSSLTGAGTSLGTPAYMSPEQCQSNELDARSDLYSLGIILFRSVTGVVPFGDRNPLTVMFKHASQPPPDLRAMAKTPLSDAFVELVMRSLAKQPSERFASAREMRKALEAARDGLPLAAKTASYWRTTEGADAMGPDSEPTDTLTVESTSTPRSHHKNTGPNQPMSVHVADEHGAMTAIALFADTLPAQESAQVPAQGPGLLRPAGDSSVTQATEYEPPTVLMADAVVDEADAATMAAPGLAATAVASAAGDELRTAKPSSPRRWILGLVAASLVGAGIVYGLMVGGAVKPASGSLVVSPASKIETLAEPAKSVPVRAVAVPITRPSVAKPVADAAGAIGPVEVGAADAGGTTEAATADADVATVTTPAAKVPPPVKPAAVAARPVVAPEPAKPGSVKRAAHSVTTKKRKRRKKKEHRPHVQEKSYYID